MSPTTPPDPSLDAASQARIIHNVSLGALIVCPIIILIPPRKFDVYTIALLSGTFLGGNQIIHESTGQSMVARWQNRMQRFSEPTLPPKALERQEAIRKAREAQNVEKLRGKCEARVEPNGVMNEITRREEEAKGVLEKVWLGGEGEDWKKKRDEREKEALEEGRGYGGLITDQIWEVWNWGKDKTEEVKQKDEGVLEERRRAAEEKKK